MKITIEIPIELEQDLICQSKQENILLQDLILQALHQLAQSPITNEQWLESVLSHEGIPDFPAFETYRDELMHHTR